MEEARVEAQNLQKVASDAAAAALDAENRHTVAMTAWTRHAGGDLT